ncbi:MAG TPA: FtsW/RodA/SpoVE family cell cycle protein [Patescibacteria group bacterium]
MKVAQGVFKKDTGLVIGVIILIAISLIILRSIAPFVFPLYFVYLIVAIALFIFFSQIDFDSISLFYVYFYIGSIFLLIAPLVIGQVTRGTVRWIPLGPIAIQPAEIVRPFLLVFFAKFYTLREVSVKRFLVSNFLFLVPFFLILVQPSLGVAIMTAVGYLGIVIASTFKKKYLVGFAVICAVLAPLLWQFLAPYQKGRILSFISGTDSSYNSIQSMIAVGSGRFLGMGLGKGVETQLAFLPEKHTDFVFAAISEELGFVGAALTVCVIFFVLYRIIKILEVSQGVGARIFISGMFLTLFVQVVVHIGMNMGLFPITGLPLPLVSAGGSSLVATMIALGMVIGAKK